MAVHIHVSAGTSAFGSRVNVSFDNATTVTLVAYSAASAIVGNLLPSCTWTVLDHPVGSSQNSAFFQALKGGTLDGHTIPSWVPDAEGTWLFRCTNNADSTVDEVVVGTRNLRTNIRLPAAGETTEADTDTTHTPTGKGWALDRNRDLDVFDDLCTSGGVQLCFFQSASLAAAPWSGNAHAGALVQFIGESKDINPTTGVEEIVPIVDLASTTGPGVGRYVGVIKAKHDGTTSTIASGSRVWVSRSGVVQSSVSGVLDFSTGWSAGDTAYVGATAGIPAKASEVDINTATVAGVVVKAEDKGVILVTPAEISTTIFPKDQQLVEVEVFEASVPGALMWNTGTNSIKPYGAKVAVAATTEFTFIDKPNEDSTITIRDSDGTAIVFVVDDSDPVTAVSGVRLTEIAELGGSATGTAAELVSKINGQATLDVVATNPSAGKVILTQGTGGIAGNTTITVNDAAHWNAMVSETTFPTAFSGGTGADSLTLPGALMESGQNARDIYVTSVALDERCIREGSTGTASNWMEYPLVLEVHGYTTDQTVGTSIPTLSVDIGWNYAGKHSNVALSIDLDMNTCSFTTLPGDYLSYEGNTASLKELIFKSPLIKSGTDTGALDFKYAGAIANEFDNIYTDPPVFPHTLAHNTPPVSADLKLSRTDAGSFDIVITKMVLKALYPYKSRAKRLSFYERQAFAPALVDSTQSSSSAGIFNYTAGSGGAYANVFESTITEGTTGFNRDTAIANMRGETAADLVGYFPFDSRLNRTTTTTQPLRFRTIGKYKGTEGSPRNIKLRLSLRGEVGNSSEFVSTTVSTDPGSDFFQGDVEVTPGTVVASTDDDYITIVHDWAIAAAAFTSGPALDGVRYKISRQPTATNKTTDDAVDASTTEVAFGISNVILSEADLNIAKPQANLFEDHISLERFIDDNDGLGNMTVEGDCPGFLFVKDGSEEVKIPLFLDERYDPQKSISVDVIGFIKGVAGSSLTGSISLKLDVASSYFDDLIPSFVTVGTATVVMPSAFSATKTQRSIKHSFSIPHTVVAQASGVPDDNLSIPLDNRRGCLYLRLSRTDTTGPTDYLASYVSAHSAINKHPNADPYINISENSSTPLIVPGGSVHDDHHDILTTAYRHNWSFGMPTEFGRDLAESADGGVSTLSAGDTALLLPSNMIGTTPYMMKGIVVDIQGTDYSGVEFVGKHVPFSMVITAIHGYMSEPFLRTSGATSSIFGKGLSATDAHIELFLVEMCTSASDDNAFTQKVINCDDHPGVIAFPFKIFPSSTNTNEDAGVIRYVGNDLSTNISAYKTNKNNVLPRVYLPADYANGRQWMLVAVLVNDREETVDFTFDTTLASGISVGDSVASLASTTGLRDVGVLKLSSGLGNEESKRFISVDRTANTVTFDPTTKPEQVHALGEAASNISGSEIIAPVIDLNIEVAFLPNTTGNNLIY